MSLKPDASIMTALAAAGVVVGVYQIALPSIAATRVNDAGDLALKSAESAALAVSAGVAGAISLITGDPVPFIVGAGLAVALSWWHRHANLIEPTTQGLADWVKNPGTYLLPQSDPA